MEDMSIKAIMDMPSMRHTTIPHHVLQSQFGGKQPKGQLKYNNLADASEELPELLMVEDFMNGFLEGSSFSGNTQCQAAMQGLVFYGFEIVNNRQIYDPSKIMKVVVAFQKLQEKQSLFYA